MQVLLILLDARGKVVTRQELFDQVWGGVMVGDDSLNRAVARVRRVLAQSAPALFEIETIPRTGYRLTGEFASADQPANGGESPEGLSRRKLLVGGVALAASGAGAGGLWWMSSRDERRFEDHVRRGEEALAYDDPGVNSAVHFERAAAIRPDDGRVQGLLAYALASRTVNSPEPGAALRSAHAAARKALSVDPREPNAHLALTVLERSELDFAANEDRLRGILGTAPGNTYAMRELWDLLQCVGRSREALSLVERAIDLQPLGAANHFPRAQLLWILGRNAEADRIIDEAMRFWPKHRFVRFARFTIFAFTSRPRAALAMLESPETAPQAYTPEAIALWRASLPALDRRDPASIAAARDANLEAAMRNPKLSAQAVLVLSHLGEVDAAFEVANALFAVGGRQDSAGQEPARSTAWRFAPWLFTPPIAAMQDDPRFASLCDEIGLTDYWAGRGIQPDFQRRMA